MLDSGLRRNDGFSLVTAHLYLSAYVGHTYTPDNGGAVRLVAAEEMKQSKSVGMVERELGA